MTHPSPSQPVHQAERGWIWLGVGYVVIVILTAWSILARERSSPSVARTGWHASRLLPRNHRLREEDLTGPTWIRASDSTELRRMIGRYVVAPSGIAGDSAVRDADLGAVPLLASGADSLIVVPIPPVARLAATLDAGSVVGLCTPGSCFATDVVVEAVMCDPDNKCSAVLRLGSLRVAAFARLRSAVKSDSLQLYIVPGGAGGTR